MSINTNFIISFFFFHIILIWQTWNTLNQSMNVQFIVYSSSVYYLLYWFNSVFIFITKKSFLGKFSSLIQRFWKRTLMLFWSIEMFLFLVYLWLICNNPEESTYMLDNAKSFKQLLVSLSDVLKKTYSYMYILLVLFYFFGSFAFVLATVLFWVKTAVVKIMSQK